MHGDRSSPTQSDAMRHHPLSAILWQCSTCDRTHVYRCVRGSQNYPKPQIQSASQGTYRQLKTRIACWYGQMQTLQTTLHMRRHRAIAIAPSPSADIDTDSKQSLHACLEAIFETKTRTNCWCDKPNTRTRQRQQTVMRSTTRRSKTKASVLDPIASRSRL